MLTVRLDRSQVKDGFKKLLDGDVFQSYKYNNNLCYRVKKNFEGSNIVSYFAHNETVTPLNIAAPKISLKEKFDSLQVHYCRFENFTIFLSSYENSMLKMSH